MKRALKYVCKRSHLLFFSLFTLFQALIIDKIVLFGDDYYYASFFYNGIEYFISENIKHWTETNGRALVHLFDELLLANGTIIMWKIFAVAVIDLIALFCALIASNAAKDGIKNERFGLSLIISCVCISFISIFTAHQTLYWATGFLNYVFPILTTLMLFYFTERAIEKERFSPWLSLLAFIACFSTEQNSFASLCILIFAFVRLITAHKKPPIALLSALISGIIGFILLFAAPGNAVRTTYYESFYSLPFTERLIDNIAKLMALIFRNSGASRALVIFFGAVACASYERLKGIQRLSVMSLNASAALLLLVNMRLGGFDIAAILLSLTAFFVDAVFSLIIFIKTKNSRAVFFTVMAAAMQGAMLVSPEMGPRTVISSVIFLIIPTAMCIVCSESSLVPCLIIAALLGLMSVIGTVFSAALLIAIATVTVFVAVKKLNAYAPPAAIIILALFTFNSLLGTLSGYSENYVFHKENEMLLKEYKESLENGEEHTLTQKYLPNGTHKYTMPYDDPYHMHWFKVAMKLPLDTEIIYK